MSANATSGAGSMLNAAGFFGKDDLEGVEKFKNVAFRVLHDQKIEEELEQSKEMNSRLLQENTELRKQVNDLKLSLEVNIDDRERVLAFKSKRIEELHGRLRELEAINASLLETMNGGAAASGDESTGAELRAARMALLNSGKPLFHALDVCKEQEYKRLYDEHRAQTDTLLGQIRENATVVDEARIFKVRKCEYESRIASLEEMLASEIAEKEDTVHRLERKLLFENERLRKEKDEELRACQQSMEKHMRKQLDVTTQRTVEENERVQIELHFQSSQLERLVKRLDQVTAENRKNQQEKSLFEDMNASLSKKVKFYEQLFTKMQHKDEQANNQVGPLSEQALFPRSPRSRHGAQRPPLPSVVSPRTAADALDPATGSIFLPSMSGFGQSRDDGGIGSLLLDEMGSPRTLHQVTDVLEQHLQTREFTRKQLIAAIQYHQDLHQQQSRLRSPHSVAQSPTIKKKIMLPKACYSPSSYQSGRKVRQAPMTLDALIRQKAAFPPLNPRSSANKPSPEPNPPATVAPISASPPKASFLSSSEMWKSSARSDHPSSPPPCTARF